MTLERLLHRQGFGSRRECQALIRASRVTLAGVPVSDPDHPCVPDGLEFTVDGEPWRARAQATVILNKPAGYECSRAPSHHPSVLTLLPPPLVARGVQPVGRLDEDTTGLLLLTDDGALLHRLISPRHGICKVYRVTTRHPVDDRQIAHLLEGVQLRDAPEPVAARACRQIEEHRLELTIHEGRYHQVKRMLAAVGNRVEALQRIAVGPVELPADLPVGAWRWLEDSQLAHM
ncbi:MAG: pseudouridine synthase [Pseudomonadota bacterium]